VATAAKPGIDVMKVRLYGKSTDDLLPALAEAGCQVVEQDPEVVVTYGGDGALLGAEREFPGVPKFPVRDRRTAPLCPLHSSYAEQLRQLSAGSLGMRTLIKLGGTVHGRTLVGINDIFIHHANPVSAIRYRVLIDDRPYGREIVGDGVGVATVHGSTAYYRSITHSVFRAGIGLAFSNSTEVTNHLVLPEDSVVRIHLTRGPAILVADNDPEQIPLAEGDEIPIARVPETVTVFGLDLFMCPACRRLRHPRE
jgi:NAD+ kinase